MLDYCLDIDKSSKWIIVTEPETARLLPFYLTEAGEFIAGKNYYTERDDRPGYQLIYTVSGSAVLKSGGNEILLTPKTAVIIRCSEHHRYETENEHWHDMWIHLDGNVPVYENLINENGYAAIEIPDAEDFESSLRLLLTLAPKNDMISYTLISDCISRLMTAMLTQKLRSGLRGGENLFGYTGLRTALDYIHQNYGNQINIDDITKKINISKYHFIRIFKRHMGVTPYEYLIDYRINRAKILLRTTDKSIFEIACDVGYKSKSNFTAKFRAVTGTTPVHYRRENIGF